MQKISSYLYPNRIFVVADLNPQSTEWNIVYQRPLKIYKGVSNIIEFDFKNAQQRRIDISTYLIKCVIMDQTQQEVCTVDVIPRALTTGLATATIPDYVIDIIEPQFLKYSLYIDVNDSSVGLLPVYADTQFGVLGQIELVGGIFPKPSTVKVIDTFVHADNTDLAAIVRTFYSEAVLIVPDNIVNGNAITTSLEFEFENLDATVAVQVTDSDVISSGTKWTTIDTFSVSNTTTIINTLYTRGTTYKDTSRWLRVTYTPTTAITTGKVDKVLVR